SSGCWGSCSSRSASRARCSPPRCTTRSRSSSPSARCCGSPGCAPTARRGQRRRASAGPPPPAPRTPWPRFGPRLRGRALRVVITLLNEGFLRIADERFPFVHAVGRWLWFVTVMILLASLIIESAWPPAGMDWRQAWTHAVLFTTEVDLLAIKWWWIVAGGLL